MPRSIFPSIFATGEDAVDQIVLSLTHLTGEKEDVEDACAMAVRALLKRKEYEAIATIQRRLTEKSLDLADIFSSMALKHATLRVDDGKPDSHLFSIPLSSGKPLTLSRAQVKSLEDAVLKSGLVCDEARIFIHPASINLDCYGYAGAIAIWEAHQQIPEGKPLSPHFWGTPDTSDEPPVQTILGVVQSPSSREDCLHWDACNEALIIAFNEAVSKKVFKGKIMVAPPMLLFDAFTLPEDEVMPVEAIPASEDAQEAYDYLMEAIQIATLKLGSKRLITYIVEAEDTITVSLNDAKGHHESFGIDYEDWGFDRPHTITMIYDALIASGISAIILNENTEDMAENEPVSRMKH